MSSSPYRHSFSFINTSMVMMPHILTDVRIRLIFILFVTDKNVSMIHLMSSYIHQLTSTEL